MSHRMLPVTLAALTALAGGQAVAQPAPPPVGTMQLYGFIAPMIDNIDVDGASSTAPATRPSLVAAGAYNGVGNDRTNRMSSSITNFGLRGSEDLGGGLQAFFQLESGYAIGTGTLTGPPGSTRFWSRNSAVGLRGGWGTFFFGSWDTPIAWSHTGMTSGVRNPYTGDSGDSFITVGFNLANTTTIDSRTNSNNDALFGRRQGNSLQYWSPSFGGLSFRLMHSLANGGTQTAPNSARIAPNVTGVAAEYANGPLLARAVVQRQNDYFGIAWLGSNAGANPNTAGSTASSSADTAYRLLVRYTVTPQWIVQGIVDRQQYTVDGAATGVVDEYERTAWSSLVIYRNQAHTAWASYGSADEGSCSITGGAACVTSGLGASMWSFGYRYDFSRRTDVFASVYRVDNDRNGQYGVFPRSVNGIAPGSTQTAITVGLEHSF